MDAKIGMKDVNEYNTKPSAPAYNVIKNGNNNFSTTDTTVDSKDDVNNFLEAKLTMYLVLSSIRSRSNFFNVQKYKKTKKTKTKLGKNNFFFTLNHIKVNRQLHI